MRAVFLAVALVIATPTFGETITVEPKTVTEWKSVYGQVETRETIPARARIGGLVVELLVSEGDLVEEGQRIAMIRDDKLSFQVAALDAQIATLGAQLTTAETELNRGRELVDRGVATVQRLDQLQTAVDVIRGQIAATEAQRAVIRQQSAEGEVLAPSAGRVLTVPLTSGAVILPGEAIALIGGGGFYLRLAIPERHALSLKEGDEIRIVSDAGLAAGRIAKIYPLIENGRVTADVDVAGLDTNFVNARVLVSLPQGSRRAFLIPIDAVETRSGIDFVTVMENGREVERAVLTGEPIDQAGIPSIEILSGLADGDLVVKP